MKEAINEAQLLSKLDEFCDEFIELTSATFSEKDMLNDNVSKLIKNLKFYEKFRLSEAKIDPSMRLKGVSFGDAAEAILTRWVVTAKEDKYAYDCLRMAVANYLISDSAHGSMPEVLREWVAEILVGKVKRPSKSQSQKFYKRDGLVTMFIYAIREGLDIPPTLNKTIEGAERQKALSGCRLAKDWMERRFGRLRSVVAIENEIWIPSVMNKDPQDLIYYALAKKWSAELSSAKDEFKV